MACVGPLLISSSMLLRCGGLWGGVGGVAEGVWAGRGSWVRHGAWLWMVVWVCAQVVVCRQRNSLFAHELHVWEEVLLQYPHSLRAQHNLGTLLLQRPPRTAQRLARGEAMLAAVLRERPADEFVLNNLGALYSDGAAAVREAGLYRPETAQLLLRRALALQPASPSAHYNLALVYHQLAFESRRGEESQREAPKTAVVGAGGGGGGTSGEGVSEGELAYLNKAEALYRGALTYDARHVLAHNNLALLMFRQRRYADAQRQYERALQLDPQHPTVAANLALLLRTLRHELEETQDVLRQVAPD